MNVQGQNWPLLVLGSFLVGLALRAWQVVFDLHDDAYLLWWVLEIARVVIWSSVALMLVQFVRRLERRVTALEEKTSSQGLTLKEIEAAASFELLRVQREREEFEAEVLDDLEHLAPGDGGATLGA
jgi:uncharacterized coiled-coil protein SlyX